MTSSARISYGEQLVERFLARTAENPGLYLLAIHASLASAINAELLHHLRDNFLLELDPPERLSITPANEVALARLLLSPLFREIGDGLWEMEASVRALLLPELAAMNEGQRLHDVALLLERYTRDAAQWHDWPEIRAAQLVSAWATTRSSGGGRVARSRRSSGYLRSRRPVVRGDAPSA